MSFKAEIIADSINLFGHRITTFVVTFPRIVLAEFNTHRMFSRNSASSRAIPFKTMIEAVEKNPFIPLKWMKDHKGMQGTEYFEDPKHVRLLNELWLNGRDAAVESAKNMHCAIYNIPVTKQLCNRQLETYMWHTAIVTATEWDNFYALRAEGAAEIHIQHLAELMLQAQNASKPKVLESGEWHIPFGENIQLPSLLPIEAGLTLNEGIELAKVKVATARCAGVSYTVVGEDGKEETYEKLIGRHNRLASMGHWSPFEHPGRNMSRDEYVRHTRTFLVNYNEFQDYMDKHNPETYHINYLKDKCEVTEYGWCGNFRGYIQYRKLFANENRTDSRLIKA